MEIGRDPKDFVPEEKTPEAAAVPNMGGPTNFLRDGPELGNRPGSIELCWYSTTRFIFPHVEIELL